MYDEENDPTTGQLLLLIAIVLVVVAFERIRALPSALLRSDNDQSIKTSVKGDRSLLTATLIIVALAMIWFRQQ